MLRRRIEVLSVRSYKIGHLSAVSSWYRYLVVSQACHLDFGNLLLAWSGGEESSEKDTDTKDGQDQEEANEEDWKVKVWV